MNEFVKPTIEYAQLWPLLLVFGVACAGVLVEAFAPAAATLRFYGYSADGWQVAERDEVRDAEP